MSTDKIEKQIEITASLDKVWQALTTAKEFATWFGIDLGNNEFKANQPIVGKMMYKGDELSIRLAIKDIKPKSYFSYNWHPFALDKSIDYSKEIPTLIEFFLEKTATGTLLKVVESGFDKVPAARRDEAFRMNTGGWEYQMKAIDKYVAQ